METVINHFIWDIQEYLTILEDYGKPNFKYFDFVWKKMGFNYLFFYKDHIFLSKYSACEFLEESIFVLKKIFLDETSALKKSAIIYIYFKLYYTLNSAGLKIRVVLDEWKQFKSFIESVEELEEFEAIRFMFWNLFVDDAFRFVARSFPLGLDIYTNKTVEQENFKQTSEAISFWNSVKSTVAQIENTTVKDIQELENVHKEIAESLKESVPDTETIKNILEEFQALKESLDLKSVVNFEPRSNRKKEKMELESYLEMSSTSKTSSSESSSEDEIPTTFRKKSSRRLEMEEDSAKDKTTSIQKRDYGNKLLVQSVSVDDARKINELYD